jgi:hypothetical protein
MNGVLENWQIEKRRRGWPSAVDYSSHDPKGDRYDRRQALEALEMDLCKGMSVMAESMKLSAHGNDDGNSLGSRVSGPVRRISLSTSQTTSPYQSTHEPHVLVFSVTF